MSYKKFDNKKYYIEKILTKNNYYTTYIALDTNDNNKKYVIKAKENTNAKENISNSSLRNEYNIITDLKGITGVPKIINYNGNTIIYEHLGENFEEIVKRDKVLSIKNCAMFMVNVLQLLMNIHNKNILHRDIKPSNFIYDKTMQNIWIIDFNISTYCSSYKNNVYNKNIIGTPKYCSHNIYDKNTKYTKRDDLISLGYVLFYLHLGFLPWQKSRVCYYSDETIKTMKKNPKKHLYNNKNPLEFKVYMEYCYNLDINEDPDYKILVNMFYNLHKKISNDNIESNIVKDTNNENFVYL